MALVIDGNRGIGKVTALAFVQGGAQVVIGARRIDAGRQTVAESRRTGGRAEFVRTDATQAKEGESLIRTTVRTFGRLGCASSNAGIGSEELLHDRTEADWGRLRDTNVKGVWLCVHYQIAQMPVQGVGAPRWTMKQVEVDGKSQRGR